MVEITGQRKKKNKHIVLKYILSLKQNSCHLILQQMHWLPNEKIYRHMKQMSKNRLETNFTQGKKNWKHKFHLDFGLVPYIYDFPFPSVTSRSKIIWFNNFQASLRKVGVIQNAIEQYLTVKTGCCVGSLIKNNLPVWLQHCIRTRLRPQGKRASKPWGSG